MRTALPALGGLLLLALLVLGIYRLACLVVHLLSGADPTIAAALVAGALTVVSSTLAVVIARNYEARRDREAAHRQRKTDTYDSLVNELFLLFGGEKGTTEAKSETEMIEFLRETNRKLLLWSGPDALKAYAEWQTELRTQAGDPRAESVIKLVDFFLALRKDLGHSNRGLKREHLVGFLLRNPELFMHLYGQNPGGRLADFGKVEAEKAGKGKP